MTVSMKVWMRLFFWYFLFLGSSPASVLALQIPKQPERYISDDAGILSVEMRSRLEQSLRRFEEETTNQLVVATFPSLEGEVLEDFSIRLAEGWKIGQKGKDNGVILLVFKNDRKVRIEVGYGLEGALPDALCKLIIEKEIVPRFRNGKFDEGVEQAVKVLILAVKGEYRADSVSSSNNNADEGRVVLWIFLSGLLILGFYFLLLPRYTVLSSRSFRRKGPYSSWGLGSDGGGSSSSGFSGGGFSAGGGSFGGGGASGSW